MKIRNEKLLDAMIDAAAEEALFQEMNKLPTCEELDMLYKPTPVMDRRITVLITRNRKIRKLKKTMSLIGKIAAGLAILFIVSGVILFNVEASRNFILNTFLNWNSDHTSFSFESDDTTHAFEKFSINYIPEGFKLISTASSDIRRIYTYENSNKENIVILLSFAENSNVSTDNERIDLTEITINNHKGYLFMRDDNNTLIYIYDDVLFEIVSSINMNEIIHIAENISKN